MRAQHIFARVNTDGRIDARELFLRQFSDCLLSHKGKDIRVSIERKRKTRSPNQNRFMHGPFLGSYAEMHNSAGTFDFEIDLDFAKEVLKREEFYPKKGGVPIPTRRLDTIQAEKVMEDARVKYAGFWQLPYPNEEGVDNELRSKS